MSRHLSYAIGLTVGALSFAACGEDTTTQPSSPADPSLSPPSLATVSNSWSPIAHMPLQAGQGPAVGVVPNAVGPSKAYVFGGTDGAGGSGAGTRVYDVASNTWRVISNATETRVFAFNLNGVGNVRDKLYFSGGKDFGTGTLAFTKAVWEFNPVTETLSREADMPLFTADGVTGVIGDRLYVLPGSCSGDGYPNPGFCAQEPIRKLFRYNPATNIWVTKASAPHFHRNGVGGVIGDKFYVAGGQNDRFVATANLDVYDPATNTWKSLASLPTALNGVVGAVLQGHLFVIGRTSGGSIRHYAYDPTSNKWITKAVPSHYGGPAAKVFLNGTSRLLVLEGATVDNPDRSQIYTP
jgi:N-acetylneuraminic acid mutarotase